VVVNVKEFAEVQVRKLS